MMQHSVIVNDVFHSFSIMITMMYYYYCCFCYCIFIERRRAVMHVVLCEDKRRSVPSLFCQHYDPVNLLKCLIEYFLFHHVSYKRVLL